MAVSTDVNDPHFGLESDPTSPNFGLPPQQQPPEQGGVISGIAAGVGRLLNPVNIARGLLDIQPRSGLQEVLRTGRMLRDVVGGMPIEETVRKEAPEIYQQQAALTGKLGTREQAAEWTGLAAQAALLAAPALLKGARPSLREVATGERPIEATPTVPETPATDVVAPTEAALTEAQVEAVNKELLPLTEPPSATQTTPEPFPSITQSAETQRRAELQQEQPPQVRQALSLDELRLMRERNELQMQNDIARRVTGATHPAVDERLGQIEDQLTTIANRELQTPGGGEISAIEQGNAQVQAGETPLGVEARPESSGQGPSDSDNVIREAQGAEAGGKVPRPEIKEVTSDNWPEALDYVKSKYGGAQPLMESFNKWIESEGIKLKDPQDRAGQMQEFVRKIVEEPDDVSKFLPRPQEAVTPEAAQPQPPAAAAPETPIEKVGIAARYREEEQPGSVIPGVGRTSEEARTWGHDFINKGGNPYDVVNNKGPKRELWQDVGVVRAENERLSNIKRAAEDAMDKDPANPELQKQFQAADDAQRKWSKDAQPVLTRAGDALRAATRAYPREINSFSDFTDLINDHFNGDVELTPEKRAELQKAVKQIKTTRQEITDARTQDVNGAVKKAGGKVMSFEDLKADLRNTVENLTKDCVI